jgi:hypothetical protein
VARAATAIKKRDSERLLISDGYNGGNTVIPDLFDDGILESCYTYHPIEVTHHDCEWVCGVLPANQPVPGGPIKVNDTTIDRAELAHTFAQFVAEENEGVSWLALAEGYPELIFGLSRDFCGDREQAAGQPVSWRSLDFRSGDV